MILSPAEFFMNKTINGKTVQQVIEELTAPFLETDKDRRANSYVFVNVQRYRDRLDSVIGMFNYSVETKESFFNEYGIFKTVEISIYYDDGTLAVKKDGDGGDHFVFQKDSEIRVPMNLGNTNESAESDAFKRACKKLGIGVDVYHENRKINGREQQLPVRNVTGQVEEFFLYFESALVQDSSMRNAYHCDVKTKQGECMTLVIWKEDALMLQQQDLFDALLKKSNEGGKAKLMGVYQVYGLKKYPQIVFKEVCRQ